MHFISTSRQALCSTPHVLQHHHQRHLLPGVRSSIWIRWQKFRKTDELVRQLSPDRSLCLCTSASFSANWERRLFVSFIIEWSHHSSVRFTHSQLYNSFPRLMGCLPGPHRTVQHIYQNIRDFIKEEIKEHRKNLNPSTTRDYIDCYLNKIQKVKGWNTSGPQSVVWFPALAVKLQQHFGYLIFRNISRGFSRVWPGLRLILQSDLCVKLFTHC